MFKLILICLAIFSLTPVTYAQDQAESACPELDSPVRKKMPGRPKKIRPPINEELSKYVAEYMLAYESSKGRSILHIFGLRDAYVGMIRQLRGENSPEEQALLAIEGWAKRDGNNRKHNHGVQVRMLAGWKILRDIIRPDRADQPLEIEDAAIVANQFGVIEREEPKVIVRRHQPNPNRNVERKPAPELNVALATQISFTPDVERRFGDEIPALQKSFSGVVVAPDMRLRENWTILSGKETYVAYLFWQKDQPNSVLVTDLVKLSLRHTGLVGSFWEMVAYSHGISNKYAFLKTTKKGDGPAWEGRLQIPGKVAARVKFTRGIELSEIDDWIQHYALVIAKDFPRKKKEYLFEHRTLQRTWMQISTVRVNGTEYILDVSYVQK